MQQRNTARDAIDPAARPTQGEVEDGTAARRHPVTGAATPSRELLLDALYLALSERADRRDRGRDRRLLDRSPQNRRGVAPTERPDTRHATSAARYLLVAFSAIDLEIG